MPLLFSIRREDAFEMKRLFSLSPRLQAVADLAPRGKSLADVGSDHGQLPVWLVHQGVVPRAVATDIRPGPLSRGQELARRWEVDDRIDFRLCDGLSAVRAEEAETVTIAGMGGETIAGILAAASWTVEPGHCYILQAMSGMDGLRRYLSDNGYLICRELLVSEGETLYVILVTQRGEMAALTPGEIWVGRQWRGMESPLRDRYLTEELRKLCWAAEGLSRSQRPGDEEKRAHFEQAAREVREMKKEWEQWQQ